jgi:hypothetical protein
MSSQSFFFPNVRMLRTGRLPTEAAENAESKEPGLDDRHRDKDGEIGRKHGIR